MHRPKESTLGRSAADQLGDFVLGVNWAVNVNGLALALGRLSGWVADSDIRVKMGPVIRKLQNSSNHVIKLFIYILKKTIYL